MRQVAQTAQEARQGEVLTQDEIATRGQNAARRPAAPNGFHAPANEANEPCDGFSSCSFVDKQEAHKAGRRRCVGWVLFHAFVRRLSIFGVARVCVCGLFFFFSKEGNFSSSVFPPNQDRPALWFGILVGHATYSIYDTTRI